MQMTDRLLSFPNKAAAKAKLKKWRRKNEDGKSVWSNLNKSGLMEVTVVEVEATHDAEGVELTPQVNASGFFLLCATPAGATTGGVRGKSFVGKTYARKTRTRKRRKKNDRAHPRLANMIRITPIFADM